MENKERQAFEKGWIEGRFFYKNYGSLIGEDKVAILEQIQEDWEEYEESKGQLLPIDSVRGRFYLNIKKYVDSSNGNGYGSYRLLWGFYKKQGYKILYRFTIGNGDSGARCQ